jgi:hypothetical protein
MIGTQLLELLEDVFANQVALLNPTFLSVGVLHPDEALLPLQDFQLVAVFRSRNGIENLRQPITHAHLRSGDIDVLLLFESATSAGSRCEYHEQERQNP